jgi:hypothetical protein
LGCDPHRYSTSITRLSAPDYAFFWAWRWSWGIRRFNPVGAEGNGCLGSISNRAAIEFSIGFYDALLAGRPVDFAYKLGCSAIQMAGIPEHLTPVLNQKIK